MITQVHVGLSTRCNLKCKHCFVSDKKEAFLSTEKLLSFFDALEENGLTHLYYTYGEPLLADNFFTIAKHVNNKGVYQILLTNGTLINAKTANQIALSGINRVMVSIDSADQETHDNNRGVKGSFQKALNAIKLLTEQGCAVGIATTYLECNKNDMFSIETLAKLLNIEHISFLAERQEGIVIPPLSPQYIYLFQKSLKENKNYMFHDKRLCYLAKQMLLNNEINDETYQAVCYQNSCGIDSNLSLAPNGNFYRCNFINKKPIANLYDYENMNKLVHYLNHVKIKGCVFNEN